MSNLTVAVDAELIKQARVRAIAQGTSLSAKVREFLKTYVEGTQDTLSRQRKEATARLMAALEAATPKSRPKSEPTARRRRSLRDELYAGDFRARARRVAKPGKSKPGR